MDRVVKGLQLNRISLLVGMLTLMLSLWVVAQVASQDPPTYVLWLPMLLAPGLAAWGQVYCLSAPVGRPFALLALICTVLAIAVNLRTLLDPSNAGDGWVLLFLGLVFLSLVFMVLLIGMLGAFIGHRELGRQGALLLIVPLLFLGLSMVPSLRDLAGLGFWVVLVAAVVAYSGLLGRVAIELENWERDRRIAEALD